MGTRDVSNYSDGYSAGINAGRRSAERWKQKYEQKLKEVTELQETVEKQRVQIENVLHVAKIWLTDADVSDPIDVPLATALRKLVKESSEGVSLREVADNNYKRAKKAGKLCDKCEVPKDYTNLNCSVCKDRLK